MKILKNILVFTFAIIFAVACKEGIDPITPMDQGIDETAPVITINYPAEGLQIRVPDITTSINIRFEVTDDIEIGSISLKLDGVELVNYSEFKDYRRLVQEYLYENVTNGAHTLSIEAIDIEGKNTTESVNFEKVSPYTTKYAGEVFYMPFDNDYMELISFQNATIVGSPGFAGQSVISGEGVNAYAGASDSYLTFPTDGLQGDQFSAVFWMKVNAIPDRAGILVMGPVDDANPTAMNNRNSGFRFFRENAGGNQRFKLNAGNGTADTWFDGGSAADVDPTSDEWVHLAFTISGSEAVVYINGQIAKQGEFSGIDWATCDVLSIMSGAPRFAGWNHHSDLSYMDELRLFNVALSQSEVKNIIETESGMVVGYQPKYDGEVLYMPFEGDNIELISGASATEVGSPGFAGDGVLGGNAFAGATDSYLSFPINGLTSDNFSATFWYKANATPDRAGILVVGPPDVDNPDYPAKQNLRNNGFRFFREGSDTEQRFKINVGTGDGETWNDGGTIDPSTGNWVHLAFTISGTACSIYIDGELAMEQATNPIDWTGCDILSIGSGAPRFTGWDHLSDNSFIDELRLYNKTLSKEEIQTIMNADK